MGIDLLISGVWIACLLWAAVMALNASIHKLWFTALGTCAGLATALLPILLIRGPMGLEVTILTGTAAAISLFLVHAFTGRTSAAAVVGIIVILPVSYPLVATPDTPSARTSGFDAALKLIGAAMLMAPVVMTLAFREMFASLDHRRSLQKA